MKPPRVSTAGLMVLIGFVAANFAAADALGRVHPLGDVKYWSSVSPFASILLLALLSLARAPGPRRAFWGGFLASGAMALASLACYLFDLRSGCWEVRLWGGYDAIVTVGYEWVVSRRLRIPYSEDGIILRAFSVVVILLPQLAIALAGGLIAGSIARFATRRRGSVAPEEGESERSPSPQSNC